MMPWHTAIRTFRMPITNIAIEPLQSQAEGKRDTLKLS
jgi:hypothetical protein